MVPVSPLIATILQPVFSRILESLIEIPAKDFGVF